jgi:hypothetical protein
MSARRRNSCTAPLRFLTAPAAYGGTPQSRLGARLDLHDWRGYAFGVHRTMLFGFRPSLFINNRSGDWRRDSV